MGPGGKHTGRSEDVSSDISEIDEIVSMSERVTTPAGTYENCIKVKEYLADGTIEFKYYAKAVGVVREVMTWPSYELSALATHDFPRVRHFKPEPHSSRKGWVARFSSYSENPFMVDVDTPMWTTRSIGCSKMRCP